MLYILHSHIEPNRKESRRTEPILNHIRKRSKNYPVMNEPNTKEGSSLGIYGSLSDKVHTLCHMNVVNTKENQSKEPSIANDYNVSSPVRTFKDKRCSYSTSSRSLDLPFEIFHNQPNRTASAKPSLNYSLPRKEILVDPPGDFVEHTSNNMLHHLTERNSGSCSHEDSFLGFKSVFSFL